MIRINLLPAELESAPTVINPAIPVAAVGLLLLVLIVPVHLSMVAKKKKAQGDIADINSQLDRYQPIIAQVDQLEMKRTALNQRKGIIQSLESERLRYPQFMDDFIKLLPGNLWLTNLTTAMQGGDTMIVNMDVIALDNYAIADLVSNLETSQIFRDVDLGAISASAGANGSQSMTFHLTTTYHKSAQGTDAIKKS